MHHPALQRSLLHAWHRCCGSDTPCRVHSTVQTAARARGPPQRTRSIPAQPCTDRRLQSLAGSSADVMFTTFEHKAGPHLDRGQLQSHDPRAVEGEPGPHLDRGGLQGHDAQAVEGCVPSQLHQDVDVVCPDLGSQGRLAQGSRLVPAPTCLLDRGLQARCLGVGVRRAAVHRELDPAHAGEVGHRGAGTM